MTRRTLRFAAPAAALAALAAAPLCAAEQPADIPVYRGEKPAAKPLPKGVPVYRPAGQPTLERQKFNAPRPGLAMPVPMKPAKEGKGKAREKQAKAQNAGRGDAGQQH